MDEDIRWKQRFNNFLRALQTLNDAVALAGERELSTLEEQGLIQSFEFTHELAWKLLKDFLEYQGIGNITGSRDASREAFRNGLIEDGEAWMDMIRDRNLSSHTYNLVVAEEIVERIMEAHHPAFLRLAKTFTKLYERPGDE